MKMNTRLDEEIVLNSPKEREGNLNFFVGEILTNVGLEALSDWLTGLAAAYSSMSGSSSSSHAQIHEEVSRAQPTAPRWVCYVPSTFRGLDASTVALSVQYDRAKLLGLIVERAQVFLKDVHGASSGELVSMVRGRGVAEGLQAYLAYADRPFDVTDGDKAGIGSFVEQQEDEPGDISLWMEEDVKSAMFEVLRVLFVDRATTWLASSSHQAISSLVSLACVMDVASIYYFGREAATGELLDGMVRLGGMRQGQYEGSVGDVAENVAQVTMRVVDAAVVATQYVGVPEAALSRDAVCDVVDGVMYLRDACLTLCCALGASGSLRHLIMAMGCLDRLINALDEVHDELMPKLYFYVGQVEEGRGDRDREGSFRQHCCELECAAGSAASWLLSGLTTMPIEEGEAGGSSSRGTTGASIQRGEMLLQALCMLKGRDGIDCEAGPGLANALGCRYGLAGRVGRAIDDGHLFVDDAQREYMLALLGVEDFADPVQDDEDLGAEIEATDLGGATAALISVKTPLIRQVEEVLPGMYGAGFLAACLDELGDSSERVVDALLAGSIPPALSDVSHQLDLGGYLEAKEKPAEEFPELAKGKAEKGLTNRGGAKWGRGPKKAANAVTSRFLDTVETSYKDRLRNSIIATQWEDQEYDDEYDDTFDDAIKAPTAGAGPDGDLSAPDNRKSVRGKAEPRPPITGGNVKQSKLWVLDGRVYNYNKPGSRAVSSQEEADAVLAEQKLSKLEIHGLGPQGNKHVAVETVGDTKPKRDPRRSGGSFRGKEKNKAAIGNHHRRDRAAKKQAKAGGP